MRAFLLSTLIVLVPVQVLACTMFKITQGGRTMVGNNEDAWGLDPWIRFERGAEGRHGVAYVGHRDGLPQGAMNGAGLVCDGLMVPVKTMHPRGGAPVPDNFTFVRRIMRECADVDEVRQLLSGHDWSTLRKAMILFVDRTGRYLVMEGDTVFTGDAATYVAGNFRPSQCTDLDAVAIPRFQQGRAYLAAHGDTSLAACTAMMAAMKACRKKLGEGTLYTSIYDLERGLVHLYFYHDFTHVCIFDLRTELAQGDHTLMMTALFPVNAEYGRLARYRTPFNSGALRWSLTGFAGLSLITGLWAFIACVRALFGGKERRSGALRWAIAASASTVALALIAFLFMEQGVYYFGLEGALKVLPLLLLLLTLLLVRWVVKGDRSPARWVLVASSAVSLSLSGLCVYWGILIP